ncbi:MAG: redoxin domain-containing protein [Nitrospirae bacterium]|nr:MAG: redoxin domain-containing protein [Nitrospirota bacterium]
MRRHIFFLKMILLMFMAPFCIHTANAQAMLQIGKEAPDFSLADLNGKDVSLKNLQQKKAVVVVFWATWSANSKKALKRFDEFYKKHKDKGIEIIAINANNQVISKDDIEAVKKIAQELAIAFPVVFDDGLKTFRSYDTIALPSTIVISEGKIAYELPGLPLVGTEDLIDYLMTLAGEQPRKKVVQKYKPRHDAIADTNLAKGFIAKKKYDMAHPFLKKAVEKDPKYMLAYVELAKLYEIEGKTADAEETLKKALNIEPENVAVMTELGHLLIKAGRNKDSIAILERASALNSYTPSHYYYAYALGKNGQIKESLVNFEKALSLNPFEENIYALRAEVYDLNKMQKEAATDYRKALEMKMKIGK